MVLRRLSHCIIWLWMIFSGFLVSQVVFGVAYNVNAPNTPVPADGYPPTLTLGPGDTVTITPTGSLIGGATQISINGNNTMVTNNGIVRNTVAGATISNAGGAGPPLIITNNGNATIAALPGSAAIDFSTVFFLGTVITNNPGAIIVGNILFPPLAGGGTLNIYGGSISGNISGTVNQFMVNIRGPFTAGGTITSNLTVQNDGVLSTAGHALTGITTIAVGGVMNLDAPVDTVGTNFTVDGILNINSGSVIMGAVVSATGGTVNINGNFATSNDINLTPGSVNVQNAGVFTVNNTVHASPITIGSAATLNLNAGSLQGAVTNNGLLNVNGGDIQVGPLINNGTAYLNSSITTPTVTNNGSMYLNSNIASPLVTNNGSLYLNSNIASAINTNGTLVLGTAARTIGGAFVQSASGVFNTTIMSPAVYGNLTSNGAGSSLAGTIKLNLQNSTGISNGNVFTLVTAPAGLTVSNPTVQGNSAVLSFTPVITGTTYSLVANRIPFSFFGNPVLGVGEALDEIRVSGTATPDQLRILRALDGLATGAEVYQALLRLSPETNGGTLLSTMYLNELALHKVTRGLHSMRARNDYHVPTGYTAGDIADGRGSYGPFAFASNITVKPKNNIPGFNALGSGVGLLGDVPLTGGGPFCGAPLVTKIGIAGNYAGTRVRNIPNIMDSNITAWQGILYGTVDYNLFFFDGIIGWATNHYINTRHTFLGQNARGDFYGEQRSSIVNLGLNLPMNNVELAPYFSVRNYRVVQNSYVETGAPGENLSVSRRTAISQQGGGGVKLYDVSQVEDFLPEVHILFLTELRRPNLNTTAVFAEGGPSFITLGAPLSKQIVVCGFSAEGVVIPGLIVTLAYDLESRNNFWNNYGSIKVRWIF